MDGTGSAPTVEGWDPHWVEAEVEPCRMIYFSRVSGRLTRADLKAILASSQRNNQQMGITGALGFTNDRFLQILEGKRHVVNRLFQRILADPRHCEVSIIQFTPIESRLFPSWAMLFVGDDRLTQETCRRFCGVTAFRPERLTADNAMALLTHLAADTAAPAGTNSAAMDPASTDPAAEPAHSPV